MNKRHAWVLLGSLLLIPAGCSQATVEKAEQAGGAAGEAIESAAEDTATNIDQAAQQVDEAIEVDQGEPATSDADEAAAAGDEPTP